MGGDEGTERLCELAFLCFTFFWLFLFAPDFVRPTAESLSVVYERMGDDDGEGVSDCMGGEDKAEGV